MPTLPKPNIKKPKTLNPRARFSNFQIVSFIAVFAVIGSVFLYKSFAAVDNRLMWAPPALNNPVTVNVTNSNRDLYLDDNTDYIVKFPSTPITAPGGVALRGGRNVVVIGGEIYNNTETLPGGNIGNAYGLLTENQTGTIHVEGLWIHGKGIGQGLLLSHWNGAVVQVQNTRIETLNRVATNGIHTDGFQSWAGPKQLKMYNVTIKTQGVGIQTQPADLNSDPNQPFVRWHYENMDITQLDQNNNFQESDGNPHHAYALWKNQLESNHVGGVTWPEYHKNMWLSTKESDATGKAEWYTAWGWWPGGGYPNGWSYWNPGGNDKGWDITGEVIKLGKPPAGDFVPEGKAGTSYVSPGYVGTSTPPTTSPSTPPTTAPAPKTTITASPTSVSSGGTVTLNWSSMYASSCTAAGAWSGSKPTSGSQSISATSSTTYTLTCSGEGGTSSASVNVSVNNTPAQSVDTTSPSTPQCLAVTGKTQTSISISWCASTDNVKVEGYKMWRGTTLIATTTSLNYSFNGLQCGTNYTDLGVQAFDASGNVSHLPSAIVVPTSTFTCSTTTPPAPSPPPSSTSDTQSPSIPPNFRVTATGKNNVTLAWGVSTDNVAVAGYRLYRDTNTTPLYDGLTRKINNTELLTKSAYSYYVRAYDKAGNTSAPSAKVCVSKWGFWNNFTRSRSWKYC